MTDTTKDTVGYFQEIPLAEVEAWPGINPRFSFRKEVIEELAESIKTDGLIQPVAVAAAGKGASKGVHYWLYAGERRLRACHVAKTGSIAVIVRDVDEATAHRLAGIENLGRENLTAIEEGVWLVRELELTGSSQKELGEDIGRSQAWIANRIRLLELPKPIRNLIHDGTIAPAMARDHLLRFLKLAARVKILPAIAKGIRKAVEKDGGSVEREKLREITVKALDASGAEMIDSGWVRIPGPGWKQVRVTPEALKRFKGTLGDGLCVQAVGPYGAEATFTFDAKAWLAFLKELEKAEEEVAKKRKDDSPDHSAKIKNAKLGVDKKPRKLATLETSFGYNNVFPMADLGDLEGIKPSQVIPGLVDRGRWVNGERKEELRTEFVYVGLDARKREEAKRTAQGVEVQKSEDRARRKATRAAAGTTADVGLRGLVDVLLRSYDDLALTTCGLLRAMGRDVPRDWGHSPYSGSIDQIEPRLSAEEVRTLAGAVAGTYRDPASDNAYASRQKRSDAAAGRVTKRRAKALEDWIAEHAPNGAK